jgi:transposase
MPIQASSTDLPDDIATLRAALATAEQARREAEARACGAEAMVAHLKLLIAKLKHDRFGASSERSRKLLDQLELDLEELEATTSEEVGKASPADASDVAAFSRRKPARGPLPDHLPRERVVLPSPSACPCCGGKLSKLGEDITETLEVVPRRWKVVQTVREKFSCRACETITQPPAPFHPIARGRAGPNLLATILEAKFAQHLPLNRQSETFAREGIKLDVSTLADWVGACTATLSPLVTLLRAHVLAGERLHGDDTTVPVLAKGKTSTGRLWVYARDDRPFAGQAPPAAMFFYSPDRTAAHPNRHLAGWQGILQSDAYAGFNDLFAPTRPPGPVTSAGCWAKLPKVLRAQHVEWQRRGMCAESSSSWRNWERHRWRSRQCGEWTRSSPSNEISTVGRRSSAWSRGRTGLHHWSAICTLGYARHARSCRATARSARPATTCSSAGRRSIGSSATAGCA